MNLRHFQLCIAAACVGLMGCLATPAFAQQDRAKPDAAEPVPVMPWMGVRITPVPDALAAHLPLGRTDKRPNVGVMVLNIVADGPADKAGLKQYDVIIALGDEPVTDEMGRFVRALGQYNPGDKARMTVVRGHRRVSLSITLDKSKPALKTRYTYRYPEQPSGVFAERQDFRGAILTRSDAGWQWQDFREADPALFADLPAEVRQRVMRWTGNITPINRTMVKQGNRTIELVDHSDGRITVRTGVRDKLGVQQTASRTYADIKALEAVDPDAFKMYQRIAADPTLDAPKRTTKPAAETVALASPLPDGEQETVARILEDAEAYQDQIREYEKFLEQYTEYLRRKVEDPNKDKPLPAQWKDMLDRAGDRLPPEREFIVQDSGRIDVRIRKGTGDLIISFRNEQEMKQKYPKLHEQYRRLVEVE